MSKHLFDGCLIVMIVAINVFAARLTRAAETSAAPRDATESSATVVGKDTCAQCHEQNHQLHSQSGHSSTFALTTDDRMQQLFAGKTVDAGDGFGFYHYESTPNGLVVRALQEDGNPDNAAKLPLPFALGSGRNAITPFSLASESLQESLIEHRVSWYKSHGGFGLTPGHVGHIAKTPAEHFGQTLRDDKMQRCVDCHTTSGQIKDQRIENLVPNVDCEKCHGPGSEHVRQAKLSDKPPPFSVGRADWDLESELQLCGSCHRLPKDFDAVTLRQYPTKLLRMQPIGLVRSECYLQSDGQMMCTTCHNPHQDSKAKSAEDYIQDCRNCHQPSSTDHVACPIDPVNDCINCHMPPISVEQGMVFHDHWIRVRPDP